MKAGRVLFTVGLLSSLLGAVVFDAQAATVPRPINGMAIAGDGTSIDWAIDASLASRDLSAADRALLREQLQMQFQSLSTAARQQLTAGATDARNEEAAGRVLSALSAAVATAARQAEAAARAADLKLNASMDLQSAQAKLGGDGDLVYLATLGPCRIYDSRNGPGQLPAGGARQVYTISIFNGYSFGTDQGGSGVTGSGNCVPTAFFGTLPTAVVATVTVVNTTASGALQAWNGGTVLSGGAVVNWNAGDRLSNTTIIPMNRSIAAYPASGAKRDIAVNNNSGAAIDFVIDVVGYMIENQATALDCVTTYNASISIPANSSVLDTPPACTSGYVAVAGATSMGPGLYSSTLNPGQCRMGNLTGGALFAACGVTCCRVPGR
jgi:hypothetical protein